MVATPLQLDSSTSANGRVLLSLRGSCLLSQGDRLWRLLRPEIAGADEIDLDLSQLEEIDGAGAALLQALRTEGLSRGARIAFVGGDPEVRRMIELYSCAEGDLCGAPVPRRLGFLDQVGRATAGFFSALRDVFAFVGELTVAARRAVNDVSSVSWRDVPGLMERAGADGVPIVLLINFLVGLIVGLQAAFQLQRFGANIFIADLVGLSMVRELAPLMTAIVVAGRSGAAYAAELGTMRVNQEIDALQTLGIDPHRYLVFPRLVAMGAVVPLLTLVSMLVGVFGGLIVAVQTLNLTTLAFFVELQTAVGVGDVIGGLIKSGIFAITITLISCQRGLAARGGAAGVGSSTTSAVVVILFAIVVIDALFTVVFNLFGI